MPVSIEPDRLVRGIIDRKPNGFSERGDPFRKAIEHLPVRDEHARLHLRLQRAHRVSGVAKILSATSTSLPVSARMSDDFLRSCNRLPSQPNGGLVDHATDLPRLAENRNPQHLSQSDARSADDDSVIVRSVLSGARGYVWGAHFDESGKGSLRMTAIDASQFSVPSSVAHGGDSATPPPETWRIRQPRRNAIACPATRGRSVVRFRFFREQSGARSN